MPPVTSKCSLKLRLAGVVHTRPTPPRKGGPRGAVGYNPSVARLRTMSLEIAFLTLAVTAGKCDRNVMTLFAISKGRIFGVGAPSPHIFDIHFTYQWRGRTGTTQLPVRVRCYPGMASVARR